MPAYVMSMDQGTTSSRTVIFDGSGRIVASAQEEFAQIYPQPGWVEHDPEAIWATQLRTARAALETARLRPQDVAGIGITNQRETTLVWDRRTGKPLYNAIVWQCRRTADQCEALRAAGWEEPVRAKTGLVLDPYFSGTKLQWLLRNVPGLRDQAERGEALFGTVDSFLMWRLSGGTVHATDASNASRTMLYNIHTLDWDDDLLHELDVPRAMLPTVRDTSGAFGVADPSWFGGPIALGAAVGDQQAALFGQACFESGMGKATYGTGCFILANTGRTPVRSRHGLLTTIAWRLGGEVTYALEGSVFIAGAAIQWLRDGLRIIASSSDSEALAAEVPNNGGVYLVPAFVGLGAPYWDPQARGMLIGITRGTTRAHVARAALEAICYQTRDVLAAMEQDSGESVRTLRVDGGASANNLLLQLQADLLGVTVRRPAVIETTALGAAYLAGLAAGVWESPAQIAGHWRADREASPLMAPAERDALYARWKRAVERCRGWVE